MKNDLHVVEAETEALAMNPALPEVVRFGREVCGDLDLAQGREWWLGNGLGAYAAGTVAGSLTRRYHGLLVAPVQPPLGRHLVFAKADARVIDGDREWALATNVWGGGSVEPSGYRLIESFRLDGRMPVWTYACGDARIEQRIWLEPGANTSHIAWRLVPGSVHVPRALTLQVDLLVNTRDHHGSGRPSGFEPQIEARGAALQVLHPGWFTLHLRCSGGGIEARGDWYDNFDLTVERERGLADNDSHFRAGAATLDLQPGRWVGIVASLGDDASTDLDAALRRFGDHDRAQLQRARLALAELRGAPAWIDQLVLAADSFVFARPLPEVPDGESVIAGYPWFGDWGRDTMIALPGLTLATGRAATALRILKTFGRFVDRGMLPNVFPGSGDTPEYNTADAALWYVQAWQDYVETTGDLDALRQAMPTLAEIIRWHVAGTRYGIGLDPGDGLLRAGESGVQITWMDAKVGDWVVTPRIGKPVEINALWFNALMAMVQMGERLGTPVADYRSLAAAAGTGFQRFMGADHGGLYDVLDVPGGGSDTTLRPNQIFAVSLPHSPLEPQARARVVAVVGRTLLTSYGLRSLSPEHPDYRAFYRGGVWERDGSYHQGPVWTWLLGHYALAEFRMHGDAAAAQARLAPIAEHLADAALGQVSEIFDGAEPHRPRGAPAQAWSVACTLQAWVRLERARRAAAPHSSAMA
jgi:predicted glycogen debranching enzyme